MPKRLSKRTSVFKTGGRGVTHKGRKVGKGLRSYSGPSRGRKAGKFSGIGTRSVSGGYGSKRTKRKR